MREGGEEPSSDIATTSGTSKGGGRGQPKVQIITTPL